MTDNNCTYKPLIIIGSPRSGTNMLRDVLVSLHPFATWPCDEINYIWRHGNILYPSDEFTSELACAEVVSYIRKQFYRRARINSTEWLVEKTCANSLRVDFVDTVIPEAKYIFIYRDGYDVIASAMKRWKAEIDVPYLIAKARFIPSLDLPYYVLRYLWGYLHRFYSSERRYAFWGPRLNNMDDLLEKYSLEEVCALQWQRCVESAQMSLEAMDDSKTLVVKYEEFVNNSCEELLRICRFLDVVATPDEIQRAVEFVSSGSIGKGRHELGEEKMSQIEAVIGHTLKRFGYG